MRAKGNPPSCTLNIGSTKPKTHTHQSGFVHSITAQQFKVAGERRGDSTYISEDLPLPFAWGELAHPALPERLTVVAPAEPAPVPILLYFPLDVSDLGAVNPLPNNACHFFTLSSKSVSS